MQLIFPSRCSLKSLIEITDGGESELISPETPVRELLSFVGDEAFWTTLIGCDRGNGAALTAGLEDGLPTGEQSLLRCEVCICWEKPKLFGFIIIFCFCLYQDNRTGFKVMQTLIKASLCDGTGNGCVSPSFSLVPATAAPLEPSRNWLGLGTNTKSSASSGVVGLLFWVAGTFVVTGRIGTVTGGVLGGVERRAKLGTGNGGVAGGGWDLRMNEWLKKSSNSIRSFALRLSKPVNNAVSSGEVPEGIL